MEFSQSIFNAISTPILIAKPVYNKTDIIDFEVLYVNNAFDEKLIKIETGERFTDFKAKISKNIDWFSMGVEATLHDAVSEARYYSESFKTDFNISMKRTDAKEIVVTLIDISATVRYEKNLSESLITDTLTALPNRLQFTKRFTQAVVDSQKGLQKFALILFDLDNMKALNNTKGQMEGDRLLIKAAGIFLSFKKDDIEVFRFGDDEFILLVKNIENQNYVTTIADSVLEEFNKVNISISGGIAVFPDNTPEAEDLLRFSDLAMRDAKEKGRNRVVLFSSDMYKTFLVKMLYKTKMPEGFNNKEFKIKFQPQFDIPTDKLRGFEALLRWDSKELGQIPPDDFIPVAEDSGFILTLGTWVLEEVFKIQKRWEEEYKFDGILSVNVSPIQLKENDFISILSSLKDKYHSDATKIEIEITEGVMIDNPTEIIRKLQVIRGMGFGLSMDDFGTGYSSLKYIKDLPLTTLKIDKSFVQSITDADGLAADITNAIISMVTKMGLDTIAEGVEHSEQLMLLKLLKCKNVQGFLRGKPMTIDIVEQYLSGDEGALDYIGSARYSV